MYNQYDEKGLKTGLWIERDERGCLVSEKEYKAGKLNGEYRKFDDKEKLISKFTYKDNVLNGKAFYYSDEKLISLENYLNGEKNGERYEWNLKGNPTLIVNYKTGKKDGACITFEKETNILKNILFYGEDVRLEEIDFEKGKTIGITWYEENSPAYNFGFTGNRTVTKNYLIETKLYDILKSRMTEDVIEFLKNTDLKDIFV